MAIVKVTSTAFNPQTKCIKDFLSGNTTAFYIPNYQREYSWRKENIEQLETDIEEGLTRLITTPNDDEVRFLGTLITIQLLDPLITKPSPTYTIIDGQQRLTTISVLSSLILHKLHFIVKDLKKLHTRGHLRLNYTEIDTVYGVWKDCLMKAVSTDFYPSHRPKIIREGFDKWDNSAPNKGVYNSPLATYIYTFIDQFINETLTSNRLKSNDSTLENNMSILWRWIEKICTAHRTNQTYSADNFLKAGLWKYGMAPITDLDAVVGDYNSASKKGSEEDLVCQFVQLLSACHYLFDACCFTVIDCSKEDWAFDLFQSLNATGTPLTVIETFKPLVVNTLNVSSTYSNSISEKGFTDIESLFIEIDTAEQKNSITQNLITSFFVSYAGTSVSSHFSNQRRALVSAYNNLSLVKEKEEFIQYLGHYSLFYKIWQNPEPTQFSFLAGKPDSDLVQMLILFLKASNHKMAITVLGRFYHEIQLQSIGTPAYNSAVDEFIDVTKTLAAFYFLWRASYNNTGLDIIYRNFFNSKHFFSGKISSSDVKAYLKSEITNKFAVALSSFMSEWKLKSYSKLNKEDAGNPICRLALLAHLHDTADDIGTVKLGTTGIRSFLTRQNWEEPQLKTIEHIAPQNPPSSGTWDPNIYTPNSIVHSIGNLTLLPQEINSAAGNNDWATKCGLYQFIGAPTPVAVANLNTMYGSNLSSGTQKILTDPSRRHITHLTHITNNETDPSGTKKWDKGEIDARTQNIIDIAWERFSPWLF